jgi:hypothetical protein
VCQSQLVHHRYRHRVRDIKVIRKFIHTEKLGMSGPEILDQLHFILTENLGKSGPEILDQLYFIPTENLAVPGILGIHSQTFWQGNNALSGPSS